MSKDCGVCPSLRAEIGQLRGEIALLNRIIEQLRRLLFQLRGEVTATVNFIDREQLQPSMPRKRFVPTIHARLCAAVENTDKR